MSVRHTYTIICDDVRREDNGKLIILGMYMGTIVLQQLPATLPTLTILSLFESDRPESWSWKLSVQTQSVERSRTVAEARGFAQAQQPGPGILPVKFVGLTIDEEGAYNAVLEIDGQREPLAVIPFTVVLPARLAPGQSPFPVR
jgi:hypothetical protein